MIYVNISGYKFIELENLSALQSELKQYCIAAEVKGTILLGHEGININLMGDETAIHRFLLRLADKAEFNDITFKISTSERIAFKRLHVKIKPEIITTKQHDLRANPNKRHSISPSQLKKWLDEKKDFILLDTRNDYETQMGTFDRATVLPIQQFRDFFPIIQELSPETKNKPVVMFCTGGIRCEKALPKMLEAGFKDVYQLDGGILNYFIECGDAHYQGDCFVFDDRITITAEEMRK